MVKAFHDNNFIAFSFKNMSKLSLSRPFPFIHVSSSSIGIHSLFISPHISQLVWPKHNISTASVLPETQKTPVHFFSDGYVDTTYFFPKTGYWSREEVKKILYRSVNVNKPSHQRRWWWSLPVTVCLPFFFVCMGLVGLFLFCPWKHLRSFFKNLLMFLFHHHRHSNKSI